MTDDNTEDLSSHSFFVQSDFPFVFIPSTSTARFAFTNNQAQVFIDDNQTTTDVSHEKETDKENVSDQNEENDNDYEERNDLRISQPEYSQLLRDLDFSETRLYDVTKLLSNEAGNYTIADENQNQQEIFPDDNYQNLSYDQSSLPSNESVNHQSSVNVHQMKETENLIHAANDVQCDLNQLSSTTTIREVASTSTKEDTNAHMQQEFYVDENYDTNRQRTQTHDPNNSTQENIPSSTKPSKTLRFTTANSTSIQDDDLSSVPRLSTNTNNRTEIPDQSQEYALNWNDFIHGVDGFMQSPTVVIYAQSIDELHTTPPKQQQQQQPPSSSSPNDKSQKHVTISPKQKKRHRLRQLSGSSETDSVAEYTVHRARQKQHSTSQPQLSIDEDYNDLNTHLKQVLNDQERPYTSASDILLRRLSHQQIDQTSPNKKKSHHRSSSSRHLHHEDNNQSINNDTWLAMLEKLEREHKERLENQQKQYEAYMHELEEKMKRRFEEYLSSTHSLQESKSESADTSMHLHGSHDSASFTSNDRKHPSTSHTHQYRSIPKDLDDHHYATSAITNTLTSDRRQPVRTNLSRSQSREDISTLRTELSVKHAKHISDLKSYYEHEIEELKSQLSHSKMGHTSSSTRQSLETIERITNENSRLHDEIKELRRSSKLSTDENNNLKRQVEDLREQLNSKDYELKSQQRTINEVQHQLTEERTFKERQDEKIRYADKQTLLYRQENEKITSDLNLTRERLGRLEERYRDLESEIKIFRQQGSTNESNSYRINDNHKYSATLPLNMPTSREYGRFTTTTTRYSSSTVTSPRSGNLDSERYTTNGSDDLFHHGNSPRPLLTLNDYINEKPRFPPAYVPPSRPLYSPRKSAPNLQYMDQMPVRDLIDHQMKQSEQLEEKFDELLKKKRDLESRINRIPTRGLTSADRQLLDVLEREIERVEQQISSVKLELRKLNILRTH